ncbi:putative helicase mov-10-B.1 [Patiria miniata]|uniref:RNA helicase n=1 Tax=Patiria miniata TaxID=46514 RepID=A0A913ZTJ6_PATMI|nr:putative helicase mov-10-B.1 [Patiria miniata]XP_038054518.1 putative helicase mov-10-B.1 [Patiria miniata]XP_038054519.1 putative helicase mov-10-B.1 [Patiria miniata]XP_038054520.1 putative helicase mov-10-B.1 [Patiria miniata]XP_038054521.1 putative helicase mov-10-B.1 [Patiria miniata]
MKRTKGENLRIGKSFLQYLQDVYGYGNIVGRKEMGDIFRDVFKPSLGTGGSGFNLSSVLYALGTASQVELKGGKVHIQRGFHAKDQYTTLHESKEDTNASSGFLYYCPDCDVRGTSTSTIQDHVRGKKHLKQIRLKYLKDKSKELVASQRGINVHSDFEKKDGVIALVLDKNCSKEITITIKNTSATQIMFLACEMLKAQPAFCMSNTDYDAIEPGEKQKFQITVYADTVGVLQTPLLFAFNVSDEDEVFHMLRFLSIQVKSKIADDLPPTVPYQRPAKKSQRRPKGDIVDGVPLEKSGSNKLKMIKLGGYRIPDQLRDQINSKDGVKKLRKNMKKPLSWGNYASRFSSLLHQDECQMEVDIRRYDMDGVTMRKQGKLLYLKVPGLAENRPSVLQGDHLFATFTGDRSNSNPKMYKGYVHHVELEEVALGFNQEFVNRFINGTKVYIEFTVNRFTLCMQHFAIGETPKHANLQNVLFPTTSIVGDKPLLCSVPNESQFARCLYDQKLASNTEQVKAVLHILQGTSRPAPYLVFGPPGTGKTVTIVEAIKQVYKTFPGSRILVCAPSNSASDLIAKRLLSGTVTPVAKTTIFRMNARSTDWKTVDETLKEKECCNYNKMTGHNYFPPKEELLEKRILVTTLCTAGRIATAAGFPYDHFTHVFIDEAGHAVEPEAIISLANLLNPNHPHGGQVVLAGDPKQLGPIIRSPLALEHGLGLSFLERLMTGPEPYHRQDEEPHYDSRVLTKLLHNYRSHPAILKLPNQMFYANELEVHADKMARESLCKWEKLPKKNFPVIFHGVEGIDEREARSPSFFNADEIGVVVEYTQDLLAKRGGIRVKETDIGIISPYRRQVQKIKGVLKKHKMSDIKVGSVEEFQGQERLVIIVSTVRSTKPEHIQMDIDYKLGFLKNPKRLNVAVTRAKALLILVGNPYTLRKDENWNMFLEYCLENKAYTGCFFKNENDEVEDTIEKFEKLKITSELVDKPVDERLGVSAETEQHDPEWRSEDY